MVLRRVGCSASLLLLAALVGRPVGAQCVGESWRDFGIGFLASAEGFALFQHEGRSYTRFLSNPVVHRVEGNPGGFLEGDTIIAIDDAPATSREAAIARSDARDVRFTVRRDGRIAVLEITPVVRCRGGDPRRLSWLGLALTCDDCEPTLHGTGNRGWLFRREPRVAQIDPGRNASGFRVGDVIVAVQGVPITSPDATEVLRSIRPGDRVRFDVRRDGRLLPIEVVAAPSG